jgi:hypothetical protein
MVDPPAVKGRGRRPCWATPTIGRIARSSIETVGQQSGSQVTLRASFPDCDGLWWAWMAERELLPLAAKLRIA